MPDRPLLALTLIRPWSALVTVRPDPAKPEPWKPIENRPWAPSPKQLKPGDWFAIHAGKKWDDDCAPFAIQECGVPAAFFEASANRVESAIVGVVRYGGVVDDEARCTESQRPWFFGPVGWIITEAVAIDPVPCRGMQGLWRVSEGDAHRVREGFKVARAKGATT